MSDIDTMHHTKRSNTALSGGRSESPDVTNKRQEIDTNGPKPGRKPLQSEPKNKRTAQNRALQRLFRERKERRMKELEDKVANLEGEKLDLHNESEFLRIQVETLMSELKKYRGDGDISYLLPKKVPALSSASSTKSSVLDSSKSSTPMSSSSSTANLKNATNSFEFPWGSQRQPYRANTAISSSDSSVNLLDNSENNTPRLQNNPGLSSGKDDSLSSNSSTVSTSNSPGNDLLDLGITRDKFPYLGQSLRRSSILGDAQNDEPFDEQLNEFCLKLSEACGSKSCPIPKSFANKNTLISAVSGNTLPTLTSKVSSPFEYNDQLSPIFNTTREVGLDQAPEIDAYSFLDQNAFDPSIAFDINDYGDYLNNDDQNDNLGNLVTEESMYDPLGMFSAATKESENTSALNQTYSPITNNDTKNSDDALLMLMKTEESDSPAAEDSAMVVPSTDGNMMKCSAIWDRITQHPRYTEIDIDGLCTELKQKLKCSGMGAVVDSKDVNKLLEDNYLIKTESDSKNWFA